MDFVRSKFGINEPLPAKQLHKDFDPIVIRFLKDRFSVGEKTRTYKY